MGNKHIELSVIVPVFNRPSEVDELLESLAAQTKKDFEVIIVEDGSAVKCNDVVDRYRTLLNISYYYKDNTGPGQSRNYGFERAKGNYGIVLDSDCILPPHYIETVLTALETDFVDAFGGPDKAHESFTDLQKAINYAMTSFLTTGGIRGGGEKLDKFYPRSFNMGFSREVFDKTGGFPSVQFAKSKAAGEDIELSINIYKQGFQIGLIKDAYVFHKRRTSIKQFFRQVYNFGYARISLSKRNKNTLKAVHFLPAVFTVGALFLIAASVFISAYFIAPLLVFTLLLFTDASIKNKSVYIGLLAILTSYIQLTGYGYGFMVAFWKRILMGNDEFSAPAANTL